VPKSSIFWRFNRNEKYVIGSIELQKLGYALKLSELESAKKLDEPPKKGGRRVFFGKLHHFV
jgi:hypothetical protein